jgi:single-strand DNA-binding protein
MNKVILIGRLTKDIELRYTSSNIAVATFTIAINQEYLSKDGNRGVDFINCVTYKIQAENIAKYCSKGSQVAIEGRIQTRNYDDKDGKKVYITEIKVNSVEFIQSIEKKENTPKEENKITPEEVGESKSDPFAEFGSEVQLSSEDLPF